MNMKNCVCVRAVFAVPGESIAITTRVFCFVLFLFYSVDSTVVNCSCASIFWFHLAFQRSKLCSTRTTFFLQILFNFCCVCVVLFRFFIVPFHAHRRAWFVVHWWRLLFLFALKRFSSLLLFFLFSIFYVALFFCLLVSFIPFKFNICRCTQSFAIFLHTACTLSLYRTQTHRKYLWFASLATYVRGKSSSAHKAHTHQKERTTPSQANHTSTKKKCTPIWVNDSNNNNNSNNFARKIGSEREKRREKKIQPKTVDARSIANYGDGGKKAREIQQNMHNKYYIENRGTNTVSRGSVFIFLFLLRV